jgi:hypothetical protein
MRQTDQKEQTPKISVNRTLLPKRLIAHYLSSQYQKQG